MFVAVPGSDVVGCVEVEVRETVFVGRGGKAGASFFLWKKYTKAEVARITPTIRMPPIFRFLSIDTSLPFLCLCGFYSGLRGQSAYVGYYVELSSVGEARRRSRSGRSIRWNSCTANFGSGCSSSIL